MLESMRRQGASIFVYAIFCLLIAIFVINFRPGQTQSDESGCSMGGNQVLTVDGFDVSETSYHVSYSNGYNQRAGKQRTWYALEKLIRRELLAQEADKRGLEANNAMVQDEIKKGHFYWGGDQLMIGGIFDENGYWQLNAYKNWVGSLNVSRNSYEGEQERELVASMMADLIKGGVQVSRDEALAQYLYDNTLVKYDVVAFDPDAYKSAMKLTDADLDRFLSEHGDEVQKRYKADERLYKGVGKQLKLREIFVAKAGTEAGAGSGSAAGAGSGSAAGTGSGSAAAAKPAEDGKAKLEAARAEIASGKKKFEAVASELNQDEALKTAGGDVGWRSAANATFGEKAVDEAVKNLKPGEMTPVVTTDKGSYLIQAEAERQGDLSYDQVKHEIASELAKDEWSKEAAKRAALAALDKANTEHKGLEQLFEKAPGEPYTPPVQLKKQIKQMMKMLRAGTVPEELREKLYEQVQQMEQYLQLEQAQILSMREVPVGDQPASWGAEDDSGGGGTGSAGSAGSAAAKSGGAGSGSAKAGSGAGSAAGSGTGTGTGTGTGAPAQPAPTPAPAPSKDVLPQFADVPAPKVTQEGPAPRMRTMPGIGKSDEVTTALFEVLGDGAIGKTVYEVSGKYYLVQLVNKTQPSVNDFNKEADADIMELRDERANAALETWLRDRCEKLAKDGKIKVNPGLLRDTDDKGNVLPTQYHPCMWF